MSGALDAAVYCAKQLSAVMPREAAVLRQGGICAGIIGTSAYVVAEGEGAPRELEDSGVLLLADSVVCNMSFPVAGFRKSELSQLRFSGTPSIQLPKGAVLREADDLLTAAKIIDCGAGRADEIYTSLFYRRKYSLTRAFVLWLQNGQGEQPVAAVCHDYISPCSVLLGSVAVLREFRGKKLGFAAAALAAQTAALPAYVLCEHGLSVQYKAAGFVGCELLYLYEKEPAPVCRT